MTTKVKKEKKEPKPPSLSRAAVPFEIGDAGGMKIMRRQQTASQYGELLKAAAALKPGQAIRFARENGNPRLVVNYVAHMLRKRKIAPAKGRLRVARTEDGQFAVTCEAIEG
jgi:hypothetical protein